MRWFCILALWAVASAQTGRVCYTNGEEQHIIQIPCSQVPTYRKTDEWKVVTVPAPKVTFWTFRPMRTNRETLHSAAFWVPQVLQMGATAADAWTNRNKAYGCCGRPMDHGGSLALDAGLPAGAIFVGSYVADRFLGRFIGMGLAGYGIIRHGVGAATGKYH